MFSISVVIPLYNHEKYIEDALRSILAQTLQPLEIIIVDDGSTDASLSIVAEIAAADERIIYWSQTNQDAPQTINNGIRRAKGDIVAVLNSDDEYHPERLEKCVRVFTDEPEIAAVFTGLTFMDSAGHDTACEGFDMLLDFYHQSDDLALALLHGNFIVTTSNLVIRRSVFDEIGYFSKLRYAHDLDFYLRMIQAAKQIKILKDPLLKYRIHSANTIRENKSRAFVEVSAIAASFASSAIFFADPANSRWKEFDRFFDVFDKHGISRSVLIFLCYLNSVSMKPLDGSFFLDDPVLTKYIDDRVSRDLACKMTFDDMNHKLRELVSHLAEKDHVISLAESRISAIESSLSWRITRPLRWLSDMVGRRKSRGAA